MQTYELLVENRSVRANSPDTTLVRTSVGVDQVHVLFDSEEWLGFPVSITFAQDDEIYTETLVLSELDGSDWVAEATVTVPSKVTGMVGPIRVTFQGTDQDGNHIITAKGSPLSVEEAGDVVYGEEPSEPTVTQFERAYAAAMTAAANAQTVVDNLGSRLDSMVSDALSEIDARIASIGSPPAATTSSLGVVRVGNGIDVEDGTISVTIPDPSGLSDGQLSLLRNLQLLAQYAFDTSFASGVLQDDVTVKVSALPRASIEDYGVVMPDGATIVVDSNGLLRANAIYHEWDGSVLTVRSYSGSSSADLRGPAGPQGPEGPQGPAGYELTDDDLDRISERVLELYELGDGVRY